MLASYVSAKHGYVAHFLRLHLCIATLGSVWCDSAVIVVWLGLDPKTTYDCGWKMICLYTLGIKSDICISVLACQALWPQTQLENIKTSHKKSIWVCCHYHGWKLLQLYSKLSGFMNTVRNCPDIWSKLSVCCHWQGWKMSRHHVKYIQWFHSGLAAVMLSHHPTITPSFLWHKSQLIYMQCECDRTHVVERWNYCMGNYLSACNKLFNPEWCNE